MKLPNKLYSAKGADFDLLSDEYEIGEGYYQARYGKVLEYGNWFVEVVYDSNTDTFNTEGHHMSHLSNIALYTNKEYKMGRFDNGAVAQTVENVKNETTDVAMITIGKLIYTNGGEVIARFMPTLKWYEKLLTSSKKRELALLIGTYVAIKAVQTKYDHYLLASVSAYINFQLQTELLGGVTQDTLDKIFSKFEQAKN